MKTMTELFEDAIHSIDHDISILKYGRLTTIQASTEYHRACFFMSEAYLLDSENEIKKTLIAALERQKEYLSKTFQQWKAEKNVAK